MLQFLANKYQKHISWILFIIFYSEMVFSASAMNINKGYMPNSYDRYSHSKKKNIFFNLDDDNTTVSVESKSKKTADKGGKYFCSLSKIKNQTDSKIGPGQPEMQSFQSVNSSNMVDLFTGDFSYNIPLMDVGGYPINIAYRSGISMDQEASWVGLGWNINPGTITRNLRGLPDDFDGVDSVIKTTTLKDNKTTGGTIGGDIEVDGFPLSASSSAGFFYNSYKGWGAEYGVNASITAGSKGSGKLTGGLSITSNTQDGLTIVPSFSAKTAQLAGDSKGGVGGDFSIAAPYNTRTGLSGLQMNVGIKSFNNQKRDQKGNPNQENIGGLSGTISFCSPSFTPTISIPFTSSQFTFTGKLGLEYSAAHPSYFVSGYVSDQYIAEADMTSIRPAYGYLHYQDGSSNTGSLLDFNTNKEMAYRVSPSIPCIGIPAYTYDAFSISGEGIGGMFRAYRGDLGYVFDHSMSTRSISGGGSVDLGYGSLAHEGVDINFSNTATTSDPWNDAYNLIGPNIAFQQPDSVFEAAYFRNPGEMAVNSKAFYNSIGDDDVVRIDLTQPGGSSAPTILAGQILDRYKNRNQVGQLPVNNLVLKKQRDKRTQVISYLTAAEATNAGFSKYIENYTVNQFGINSCSVIPNHSSTNGLLGEYFSDQSFGNFCKTEIDAPPTIDITGVDNTACYTDATQESAIWTGRIHAAPATGKYTIIADVNDQVAIWINNVCVLKDYSSGISRDTCNLNLVANNYYDIRVEYANTGGVGSLSLSWAYPGQTEQIIPSTNLSLAPIDPFTVTGPNYAVSLENRVNNFRKPNHISEIDVLNPDGKRYIYGIPVYNLKQKDVTFSVDPNKGNINTGLAAFSSTDNSTSNQQGKENYYDCEQMPAYAHSFLLTSIFSPDYVDLTGNGITDDDMGDAIQFKYSKVCGIDNPYEWRAPYTDSVTYHEGMKTYNRDDKGSYLYGQKELWYLHTIESKNMIATFTICNREDELPINENGVKSNSHKAQKLSRIDLYNKADFIKNGTKAIPIKTVHFEYDYELCRGINQPVNDSGKLTLKKIWFTYNGNDKGKKNPYVFNYGPNNPRYNTGSYDRWGNYKSALENPNSTSSNYISNADYPYALKDSGLSAYNVTAWTMDSIKLPSGGAIKVDYESDDYAYVQNKRAMEMFPVVGFSSTPTNTFVPDLYQGIDLDNLYIFIRVNTDITSKADAYNKYLENISQLYFKVATSMPDNDGFGSGYEPIPGYAAIDTSAADWYDYIPGSNLIRIKLKGISKDGNDGSYNPIAKAATQFLRLNIPSKAYPNSEGLNTSPNTEQTLNLMLQDVDGVVEELQGFDKYARGESWCRFIDTTRSFVRLNSPEYKKYGGGLRVKRITVYDNWNEMTGQKEATYGQEYTYTTTKEINGAQQTISSGVASYEPIIGNEENPFHLPIQTNEQISALAPVTLGYVEEPLGENFYPAASVGYSKVRERTIHHQNIKSANGYQETEFYTTYDFPTITDNSDIQFKRYKPGLTNFLKIGAKNYVNVSQGFKIELNDMDGKIKSQATYPENDSNYISYTRNYYKVDDPSVDQQHLSNTVWTIDAKGNIDTTAMIGQDIELMTSMRKQETKTIGADESVNIDAFTIPSVPPILSLLSLIPMPQSEDLQYKAAAMTKIIQRHGILDSVVHIDKGSKISTENVLYDAETGNPVLTLTRNEFNDSVFNFTYPADWAYDGMGGAYKNIDFVLDNVYMKDGKITSGLPFAGADTVYFASGDEMMANSHVQTGGTECSPEIATFPDYTKIWALNANEISGGAKNIYFIDATGKPFSGNNISLKITRSGRRNMQGSVGGVTTLKNPLVKNIAGNYQLVLDSNSKVVNTSAAEYNQLWKIPEVKTQKIITTCVDSIIESLSSTQTLTECNSYFWNDSLYNSSGVYSKHFTTSSGKDSIAVLNLTIRNGTFIFDTATNCGPYNWNGQVYANSGIDTFASVNSNGCGDTAILNLTVIGSVTHATICDNSEGYVWHDHTYTTTGIYGFRAPNNIDCEGIDSLYLTVTPTSIIQEDTVHLSCKESYSTCGQLLNESYTYEISCYNPVTGCYDTHIVPVVKPNKVTDVYDTACYNFEYEHGGVSDTYSFTTNTNYYDTTAEGCDSTTNLHIYIPNTFFVTAVGNYTWYDSTYTHSGTYIHTDSSECGGEILYLTVYPILVTNEYDTACYGGMTWQGELRPTTGGYRYDSYETIDGITYYGIDSLHLLVRDSIPVTVLNQTACNSYSWHGTTYRASDTLFYHTFNVFGCDSTIELILKIDSTCGGYNFKKDNYVLGAPENNTGLNSVGIVKLLSCKEVTDMYINSLITFDSVICTTAAICYNPLTDSSVNPYVYGVLGNYRTNKSYVYYTTRAETDPSQATDIRQNGTFKNYKPFWVFSSSGILPQYDTTKWVWNSELTMFNDKGLEIENKDPLGRYNSALYGYGKTLPVAVTQNSRSQENAFEGFEDYDYVSSVCDPTCQPARHWDFGAYKQYIDSTEHHTGRYSLRIDPSAGVTQIGLGAKVLPANDSAAGLIITPGATDTCSGIQVLKSIKATSNISLPNFQPLPGKTMVFSAWAKEANNCNCKSYTNNDVTLIATDSNNVTLESITVYPSGNIIEGWQRYEQATVIPANATSFSVVLNATGSSKVYFDDIRLHPFNANMKSFVYNSVNLRLMAELDENNYASFYEYDDDGTLVRVKKETERGIMTIQETRSALLKDQ